ncbi:hypothetical protein I6N91_15080 [Arthrobacter sp. MSA 4-2]|uniref:hypothetical protein n=1 Tax=Arthrobacter sp. MSA 4-2 TaxID=2794349 RepID=UPI0018E77647|nr:hypothetical protein [Arthrobacter sp. MSA 4-2]MBJ2122305.1 hypothetical protein [Arthrobacter sp. MSA 4-2]
MQWLNNNRDLLPSAGALAAVLIFWTAGAFGGLRVLNGFRSPLAELIGLYLMFLLLIASVAVAFWAIRELPRRLALRRHTDRLPLRQ